METRQRTGAETERRGRGGGIPVALAGTGDFHVAVVGTSHYRPQIETLCGVTDEGAGARLFRATLVPEPENPFDRNAVRIDIEGLTVGYLARREAKAFRGALRELGLGGRRRTVCAAKVIGGRHRAAGDLGLYGVRLDFEWPLRKA